MTNGRRAVLVALREDKWQTVDVISRRAVVSPSTTRRHLEALVRGGLAERGVGRALGTVVLHAVYLRTHAGTLALQETDAPAEAGEEGER